MSDNNRIKILFLCTGNSCRSQMAEGFANNLKSEFLEAYSAGIEPHGLNPNAVKVMAEAKVNISGHKSKLVQDVLHINFDYVITVCDQASENCPIFPGTTIVIHKSFDDPPQLAQTAKSDDEALQHYRRVRDEIRSFVDTFPQALTK